MAAQARDKEGRPVRFIRRGGKVIPIRASGGSVTVRQGPRDTPRANQKHFGKVMTAGSLAAATGMGFGAYRARNRKLLGAIFKKGTKYSLYGAGVGAMLYATSGIRRD